MGTRASFFIGNPQDVAARKWLGCIAFDGYPDGDCEALKSAATEQEFSDAVAVIASNRDDFCDPAKHGFPFPWTGDLFLTDYTYAWFDGQPMMTCFHRGFVGMQAYEDMSEEDRDAFDEQSERLPSNVPASTAEWDRSAPDSIMVVTAR